MGLYTVNSKWSPSPTGRIGGGQILVGTNDGLFGLTGGTIDARNIRWIRLGVGGLTTSPLPVLTLDPWPFGPTLIVLRWGLIVECKTLCPALLISIYLHP